VTCSVILQRSALSSDERSGTQETHLVSRATNLDEALGLHLSLLCRLLRCELLSVLTWVVSIASSTTGEVGLMLLSLRVGEVGALVGVQSQAQSTLESSEMIAKDVGILMRCGSGQRKR
jgi:hypothetical protein